MNDNKPTTEEVLTISDLMKRWKCARKSIYQAVDRGELHIFKVGVRSYRVTMAEVLRYESSRGAA